MRHGVIGISCFMTVLGVAWFFLSQFIFDPNSGFFPRRGVS
eukprot:CAMPEP_0177621700 /NCGR_PEP_ID=MMETSP0419_2-20121207/27733_1 /TAXON_ID=582737 /ORGANISM="Tetraselmis sp., Strain GSL018" /LENGTH=40 /DNA_ID= /DNA_START= /DNA_END= /DNA_ORIENTATION=